MLLLLIKKIYEIEHERKRIVQIKIVENHQTYFCASHFLGQKAVHCSGALLKKTKMLFVIFPKHFNRFEFHVLRAINSIFFFIL